MALVKLYAVPESVLSTRPIDNGSIYFTTDTNVIYVDLPNGKRALFSNSNSLDLDDLYDYMRDRLLSDPEAVFKGATELEDGAPGLVPFASRIEV